MYILAYGWIRDHYIVYVYYLVRSHHTHRAVEALTVVVIVERLDPPVARFDGEPASETFRCEQFIPIWKYFRKQKHIIMTLFQSYWINHQLWIQLYLPASQYGRPSSKKNGLLPNSLPQ